MNRFTRYFVGLLSTAAVLLGASWVSAQDFENAQVQTTPLAEEIYMLSAEGGNIAVSVGNDGVFWVDAGYGPMIDKVVASVLRGPMWFTWAICISMASIALLMFQAVVPLGA